MSDVWPILTRFLDLSGIPIVCQYALAVLETWLGSSTLLLLARYSLTRVSRKLLKVHVFDQGTHELSAFLFHSYPHGSQNSSTEPDEHWIVGPILISCARSPMRGEEHYVVWHEWIFLLNTIFSLTLLSDIPVRIETNLAGGAFVWRWQIQLGFATCKLVKRSLAISQDNQEGSWLSCKMVKKKETNPKKKKKNSKQTARKHDSFS